MKYAIKQCLKDILADFRCRRKRTFFDRMIVLFFRQDFHLLVLYRIARYCDSHGFKRLSQVFVFYQLRWYSCQLSPKSKLAATVKFPHPVGIVIGDGCTVLRRVRIFQHVTLGGKKEIDPTSGEIKYPTIEAEATLFPQSMVVGSVTVGERAIIGAKSLVNKDVPANSTVAGIPAKVIKEKATTSPTATE